MTRSLTKVRLRKLKENGWICSLCGRPIEHAHQATLDHKVPRAQARGVANNLQPAHYKCNQIKASLPGDLVTPAMFEPRNMKHVRVLRKAPHKRAEGATEQALLALGLTEDPYLRLHRWRGINRPARPVENPAAPPFPGSLIRPAEQRNPCASASTPPMPSSAPSQPASSSSA